VRCDENDCYQRRLRGAPWWASRSILSLGNSPPGLIFVAQTLPSGSGVSGGKVFIDVRTQPVHSRDVPSSRRGLGNQHSGKSTSLPSFEGIDGPQGCRERDGFPAGLPVEGRPRQADAVAVRSKPPLLPPPTSPMPDTTRRPERFPRCFQCPTFRPSGFRLPASGRVDPIAPPSLLHRA
jgi:hypothetical protein